MILGGPFSDVSLEETDLPFCFSNKKKNRMHTEPTTDACTSSNTRASRNGPTWLLYSLARQRIGPRGAHLHREKDLGRRGL